MSRQQSEVREVPFLRNDMQDHHPATTGKPMNQADTPGKADSECTGEKDDVESKGNITVNVDDAQLDQTNNTQTTEKQR